MVFNNFKPVDSVQKASKKYSDGTGIITVVNSSKNGKRIVLGKDVVEKLSLTDSVYISKMDESIAISKNNIANASAQFRLRESGRRKIIYCGSLVDEITEHMHLDFTDKVCHTLCNGSFEVNDESEDKELVVVITVDNELTDEETEEDIEDEE